MPSKSAITAALAVLILAIGSPAYATLDVMPVPDAIGIPPAALSGKSISPPSEAPEAPAESNEPAKAVKPEAAGAEEAAPEEPVQGGPPAEAAPPEPETGATKGGGLNAQEYFALGEESFEMGDYARAGDYYRKCLAMGPDPARQAKAHERLAFVYAAFDENEKVHDEFVLALKTDRSLTLDPEQVSPKVYEAFAKAREEVVREGTLVVNSDPAGADVQLNGEYVGEAPVRKERLAEGDYVLRLAKPGYESSESPVSIKKDVTLTIEEKMVRARGTLTVRTSPPGAQAMFDGRAVGATPLTIEHVSGGRHSISFKSDYFEPFEANVQMEKGEVRTFEAELKRRLLVIAEEDGYGPQMHAVREKLAAMGGISIVDATPSELESRLIERGLDPGSIDFILERKPSLTLEDSAALSGVMEEDRVELALVMKMNKREDGYELGLALYSTASVFGDSLAIYGKDEAELADGFGAVAEMWKAVSEPGVVATGTRLVDRAEGGVDVISVTPGLQAAAAGLLPGDIISSVDGAAVVTKQDFTRLMTAGDHDLTYARNGAEKSAKITAEVTSAEVPVFSQGYLYNLALVEFKEYIDSVPAPSDGGVDDQRGMDALNLGNVYTRMGEYEKAVGAYAEAKISEKSGICNGTALYRAGQAYEKLEMWTEAADSYRKAMLMYPGATLVNADGEFVAPLARERLRWLYEAGLTKERWWL